MNDPLQSVRRHRNHGLDALRGIAILLVLGIHFFGLRIEINNLDGKAEPFLNRLFGHGYFGVNIFFVLSGFLIASTSVVRDRTGRLTIDKTRFYARRVTRILPLLACVIVMGLLFRQFWPHRDALYGLTFADPSATFTWSLWLSIGAFVFNWYRLLGSGSLAGTFGLHWDVLWSLAVEEQFYLVFPWIVMGLGSVRRMRVLVWAVVVVASVVRAALLGGGFNWLQVSTNSFTCFDALAIGVVVALSDPWSARSSTIAGLVGSVGLLACYLMGYAFAFGVPALGIAASTALLIQAARHPWTSLATARPSLWRVPILTELGRLSYGLYLLHPIGFFLIAPWAFHAGLSPALGFVLATGFALVMARLSFDWFEQPVERVLRARLYRMIDRRRTGRRSADAGPATAGPRTAASPPELIG